MSRLRYSLLWIALLGLCACNTNRTRVAEPEVAAAASKGAHIVSSVAFNKGQTSLSEKAKNEINKAISKAREQGEVENVVVSVWADQPYPGRDRKLPKSQIDLADKRGDEIEKYLEDNLNVSDVEVHNLGETPNALEETFNTADAELKRQLEQQGIISQDGSEVMPTRASSALLMIEVK